MKKKIYIVLGAVFFLSKTMLSQDTIQRTITETMTTTNLPAQQSDPAPEARAGIFGVRYLPTFSMIRFENSGGGVVEGDVVLSHGWGAFLGLNFNERVGAQVEVMYNRLSQKYKDNNLDQQVDIDYVNIPLLLSLNTGRMRMVNLNLVVGPQWGINVGSELTTKGSNGTATAHGVLAVKDNDFGIAYGAGVDIGLNPMRTVRLDIGFRGVLGLLDISDRDAVLETNSYYILKKDNVETYSGYIGFTFLF